MKKQAPEINAGSMADIAFLLLIFFLVATTIQTEAGISSLLPAYTEDAITTPINQRNVFKIQLNSKNELLVKDKQLAITEVKQIKEQLKTFVMNNGKVANAPKSPKFAVVSISNDNSTSYESYIAVYNEVKAAYNELWNERSLSVYGRPYENLDEVEQGKIRDMIPLVISEAEPSNYEL